MTFDLGDLFSFTSTAEHLPPGRLHRENIRAEKSGGGTKSGQQSSCRECAIYIVLTGGIKQIKSEKNMQLPDTAGSKKMSFRL